MFTPSPCFCFYFYPPPPPAAGDGSVHYFARRGPPPGRPQPLFARNWKQPSLFEDDSNLRLEPQSKFVEFQEGSGAWWRPYEGRAEQKKFPFSRSSALFPSVLSLFILICRQSHPLLVCGPPLPGKAGKAVGRSRAWLGVAGPMAGQRGSLGAADPLADVSPSAADRAKPRLHYST